MRYHKRTRGRPKQESLNSPTDELKLKRALLLRGKDGSVECPIDILESQKVISSTQAEAIKIYGLVWSSAFGKPKSYSGNVWASIIDGWGYSLDEKEELTLETLNKRRERYYEVDNILSGCGKTTRDCVRQLCEGHMPYYLRSAFWSESEKHKISSEIEFIDKKIDKLKKEKPSNYKKSIDDVVARKMVLLKKLKALGDESSEPLFNAYMRGQLKLALNELKRKFGIGH